uniref:Uncharacterized protein n=1 Tax=Mycena chlorophos TaxID=658473 RepID=A0ABQ0M4E8_MYCCL|nr:predicted protein [Mycena chlorophos]
MFRTDLRQAQLMCELRMSAAARPCDCQDGQHSIPTRRRFSWALQAPSDQRPTPEDWREFRMDSREEDRPSMFGNEKKAPEKSTDVLDSLAYADPRTCMAPIN